MQRIKRLFDFYINSSTHVSLSVVALGWITYLSLDINVNFMVLSFLFFSTVTGYNFVKYAEIAGLHHRSLAQSLKTIQIYSVICGIGMLVTSLFMSLEVWVACGILGLVTLLYAIPFFMPKNTASQVKGNLRSVAGLKIFIIGVVWSGVTVILPVLQDGTITWDVGVICIQRVLFVLALMIPFEIRDMVFDNLALKTLPQIVGVKKAKIIGVTWLLLYCVLEFFKDEFNLDTFLSQLFIMMVTSICIYLSQKRSAATMYFSSFWVEGIPLLWLWLVLVINYLSY